MGPFNRCHGQKKERQTFTRVEVGADTKLRASQAPTAHTGGLPGLPAQENLHSPKEIREKPSFGDNILPPLIPSSPSPLTPLLGPDANSSLSHPAVRPDHSSPPHQSSQFCAHRSTSFHRQLKSARLPQVWGPPTFSMAIHVAPTAAQPCSC